MFNSLHCKYKNSCSAPTTCGGQSCSYFDCMNTVTRDFTKSLYMVNLCVSPSMFAAKTATHTLSSLKNMQISHIQHNTYSGHHYLYENFLFFYVKCHCAARKRNLHNENMKEKCECPLWLNFTCQTHTMAS